MLGGCFRLTGGHYTTRLEEVIAFLSHMSPGFFKEATQVMAELDMEPK